MMNNFNSFNKQKAQIEMQKRQSNIAYNHMMNQFSPAVQPTHVNYSMDNSRLMTDPGHL